MSIDLTKAEQALISAVLLGDLPAARSLLDSGISTGIRDPEHDEPLLMLARKEPMIRLLLERGADVNAQNDRGVTALVFTKHPAVLLAAGADPNLPDFDGVTPLAYAVALADFDRVELLIAHGADVNAADNDGRTPLATARFMAFHYLVDMLIKAGAVE